MDAVTINQDIYDIHGHQITKAGDVLSRDYLASIADSCRFKKNTNKPVRETFITDDLREALDNKIYEAIFSSQVIKDEILRVIGGISLNPILYEEFDLMKKRDFYTYRHVLLTTALTVRMAMDIYSDSNNIPDIAEAAFTHDFGKARVPLHILQKNNFLTPDENDFIAGHPTVGYILLIYYQGALNSLNSKVAFEHHEKIDGSGYPRGIKESNPIVELVTTGDIYDALISERPYRKETYSVRAALDYLTREMDDGKLDETTVCLLTSYNRRKGGSKKNIPLSRNFRGIPPTKSFYTEIKIKNNLKK